MLKGLLMIGAGFAVLVVLSMSDQYRVLAGLPVGSSGSGQLFELLPVSADLPAILSYTCWIGEIVTTGGFCRM